MFYKILSIEQQGLGTLPNGNPPPYISAEGITNLQLIAFNELAEVAFFTELLWNITNNIDGYDIQPDSILLDALVAAHNQEQLHTLNANTALQHFGAEPILPCSYSFPVANFEDSIRFASIFTSVVAGTLQDLIQVFAENGDSELAGELSSVVGQEGEQEGFYRILQGKTPNELPFLTTGVREFLFSALHRVISTDCPSTDAIDLPVFATLDLLTTPLKETTNISFTFDNTAQEQSLSVVYINQQNTPIVEPMLTLSLEGSQITAEAVFPYDDYEMNGLTIIALTNTTGPFLNARAVANATVFGPAFIVL